MTVATMYACVKTAGRPVLDRHPTACTRERTGPMPSRRVNGPSRSRMAAHDRSRRGLGGQDSPEGGDGDNPDADLRGAEFLGC